MRFCKDFEVYYFEVNRFLQLKPVSILNILEETATRQVEKEGFGFSYLQKLNCGWVLIRWHVEFYDYPLWGDPVQVETWPSGFDKLYATREYYLKDAAGKVLAKASSLWVFMDLAKRRPVRIPADFNTYGWVEPEFNFPAEKRKMEEEFEPDDCLEFAVRRSDIDTNKHVNNAKYLDWITEAVPEAVYDSYKLVKLDLQYKKEIGISEPERTVVLSQSKEDTGTAEEGHKLYHHRITDQEGRVIFALARTEWARQAGVEVRA